MNKLKRSIAITLALSALGISLKLSAEPLDTVLKHSGLNISAPSRGLVARTEGSELSIDPKLVDKIFEKSAATTPRQDEAYKSLGVSAGLEYGYFKPTQFTLKNKYFTVPYEKNVPNFNLVSLGFNTPLSLTERGLWSGFFSVGYAYAQDIYSVQSNNGLTLKDTMTLSWMPVLGGTHFTYQMKGVNFVRPGFRLGAGVDYISQSGELDGMQQVFWLPHVAAGPELLFFPRQLRSPDPGFEGVAVSALYHQGIASEQKLKGWSANVGTKYAF